MAFVGWDVPQKRIDAFFKDADARVLMVSGPVGTGKSAMPRHFARENGYKVVEFVGVAQMAACLQRKGKSILCIDDLPSAIHYYKDFEKAWRKAAKSKLRMRVLVCATDLYKHGRLFQGMPAEILWKVRTTAPFPSAIRKLLKSKSWTIANAADGDVRKALQMDAMASDAPEQRPKTVFDEAGIILGDDRPTQRFSHAAVNWAFDNYLDDYEDVDDAVAFAERFSAVDACREALPSLKEPAGFLTSGRRRRLTRKHEYRKPRTFLETGRKLGVMGMPPQDVQTYVRVYGALVYQPMTLRQRKKISERHHLNAENRKDLSSKRAF